MNRRNFLKTIAASVMAVLPLGCLPQSATQVRRCQIVKHRQGFGQAHQDILNHMREKVVADIMLEEDSRFFNMVRIVA